MKKTVVVDLEFMRPTAGGKRTRSRSRSRSQSRSQSRRRECANTSQDEDSELDIGVILKNNQLTYDDNDETSDNDNDNYETSDNDNDNDHDETSDSGVETDNSPERHHSIKDTDYAVDSDEDLLQSVIDEPTFPLNVNMILSAMNRTENNTIANTSKREIDAKRHEILSSLHLTPEKLAEFERKLSMYRVIENPYDLKHCQLIRWIPLRSLEARPYLTLGGTLFKVQENKEDGTHLVTIRNIKRFIFNIRFESNIMFQRLSQEELLILSVVEYIQSNDEDISAE
jgi:hypothetical protein